MTIEALCPGLAGEVRVIVTDEHTAPHVGSGRVRVLATPVLTNLLEAAALQAAESHVPQGYQTVGTRLDIRHFAATPVGMQVTARAEVTAVNGRTITFRVWAEDEVEPVGEGTHERVIINLARFDERMGAKIVDRKPSVAKS